MLNPRPEGETDLALPASFFRYQANYSFDFYELFSTYQKINGAASEKEILNRSVTFGLTGA